MRLSVRYRSLDWLNFWVADVQTGVGPFIAAALSTSGWNPAQVGLFLTVGGLTGLGLQAPAGAAVDSSRHKRTLIAVGIVGIVVAALVMAEAHGFTALLSAQVLLGMAGPVIGPAITAITLGLVGSSGFDQQLGRNQSFNAAGNLFAALLMGWVGWAWSMRSMFLAVPVLAVPALLSLVAIPAREINHDLARGFGKCDPTARNGKWKLILRDRGLVALSIASFFFHLSNAAMLPQLAEMLTHGRARAAAPFMSASVSITQVVMAILAAYLGGVCARRGPRQILLAGFAVLSIRAVLYTLTTSVPLLLAIQTLDGIANAILGIATAVYIAQRTEGSGHFNLIMGSLGTVFGLGAALSTTLAGWIAQHMGFRASFVALSGVAAIALPCLVLFVPEAREGMPSSEPVSARLGWSERHSALR